MERKHLREIVFGRQIMKDLRTLSVLDITPEERLNKIVSMVAKRLKVDVCSCYIARPGDILELCATYGLDKKSVHETYLRVGEGLVGEIALQRKSLIFEDAWSHSSFVYKPETKEKVFKSLAGVPLIRSNKLLGVLAIQTKQVQSFSNDLMEILETIGLVLAEMISDNLFQKESQKQLLPTGGRQKLNATSLISGFAIGQAVIHKRLQQPTELIATNAQKEVQKLSQALTRVEHEVNKILASSHMVGPQTAIFETYLMFLKDKGWISKMTKAIETGLSADAAVQKVGEEMTTRMSLITDPYIKERIHDVQDLIARIMKHLQHKFKQGKANKLPHKTILVAKTLGPAELLDYDTKKIKGIILEEGSQTMHMVIVTRSMNIPLVCGIKNVEKILSDGDFIALDATKGRVYVNPSDETLEELQNRAAYQKKLRAKYSLMKEQPAITLDNVSVSLNINAGLSNDLAIGPNTYYDGVGLYRTELPFMLTEELPSVKTQASIYRQALVQAKDKPVIFRALDIGSDKVLPYFQHAIEDNPAMGWRSIRMTLDRRALLRNQFKALLKASAGRDLYIMFPMISTVQEFRDAKQTLFMEIERERIKDSHLPKSVKVGTMLEVPSLIFQLDQLLKEVDFISIGTNDLSQFLFAADRSNPIIWNRYDSLSPALLRVLKQINDSCQRMGVPCSVCGEMAGRPLEAITLIGLGFRSLSMNPNSLGPVKAAIRTLEQQKLTNFLNRQLYSASDSIREELRLYAKDHHIFIE